MFRTVGDQVSLFESVLPEELLRLPEQLALVDALLDDPAFFAPFVPFFDPRIGRPSTRTCPVSGATDPLRILMSVDLPAPFSPHRA